MWHNHLTDVSIWRAVFLETSVYIVYSEAYCHIHIIIKWVFDEEAEFAFGYENPNSLYVSTTHSVPLGYPQRNGSYEKYTINLKKKKIHV